MVKDFNELSERQRNILRFMQQFMEREGYPPTIRQIGEATKIKSTSVVNYNLNKLVSAGYLERSDRVSRGLRLVAPLPGTKLKAQPINFSAVTARVPLIGQIVAGQPVQMPEDVGQHYDEEDLLDLPATMLKGADPDEVFALTVKGDSMIDAMVRHGDIVILRHQQTANNGDMVAVWLPEDSETTLKYFYREGDNIRLQPAHPHMEAIYVRATNCEIRGKVLSVIRQL